MGHARVHDLVGRGAQRLGEHRGATVRLAPGALAPPRIDVPELALAARRQRGDRVDLVLRTLGTGGDPLVYASTRAPDWRTRPRLEVLAAQ